jgi:uncharacterized repeat protein (TIGR02543 family)
MNKGQKIVTAVVLAVIAIAGIRKLSQAQPPGSTKYTLIINSGAGGTTDPAPDSYLYDSGAQATITAIPDSGYQFAGWSGSITGTVNPVAITMNGNKAVQANFNVVIPSQVDIRVDSVWVTPAEVNLGEPVICTMRVTNYGNGAGSKDVICSIFQGGSGLPDIHVPVSLAAGESKDMQILQSYGLGQAVGVFTITADDKTCTLTVQGGNAGVTGVVISSDTGLPLQGVEVTAFSGTIGPVYTGADGRFTLWGIDYISAPVEFKLDNYAHNRANVQGLTSGVAKDIGTVVLSLVSDVVIEQIRWPSKSSFAYEEYLSVGFLLHNISSHEATATAGIALNLVSGQAGQGAGEHVFVIPAGGRTYWSGIPYPLGLYPHHPGANILIGYVNGVEIGRMNITVGNPTVNLSLAWLTAPPSKATVGQTISASARVSVSGQAQANYRIDLYLLSWYTSWAGSAKYLTRLYSETLQPGQSKNYNVSYPFDISDPSPGASIALYVHVREEGWNYGVEHDLNAYTVMQ